jgi:hypothetical protein
MKFGVGGQNARRQRQQIRAHPRDRNASLMSLAGISLSLGTSVFHSHSCWFSSQLGLERPLILPRPNTLNRWGIPVALIAATGGFECNGLVSSVIIPTTMRQTIHVLPLLVAMLCATACFNHGSRQPDAQSPDRILFDNATMAVRERRFTVANLTLQTLVNTYPDSKYADRAKLMLQDPQIARCGEGFSTTPTLCEPHGQ